MNQITDQSRSNIPLYTSLHSSITANHYNSNNIILSQEISDPHVMSNNTHYKDKRSPQNAQSVTINLSSLMEEHQSQINSKSHTDTNSSKIEDHHVSSSRAKVVSQNQAPKISHDGANSSIYDSGHQNRDIQDDVAKDQRHESPHLYPITFHERYVNAYRKGLPHDVNGLVNVEEMGKLITALKEHDYNKLSCVKLGSNNRLVNPSAAWSQDLFGKDDYPSLPSITSSKMGSEMAELYCMSLCREIPFSQYRTNTTIDDCCVYLNDLKVYHQTIKRKCQKNLKIDQNNSLLTSNYGKSMDEIKDKVTPYNIYRGPMYGDLQGPYISQFLYRDIKIGGLMHKQKYNTNIEGSDCMKTWDTAISVQSGNITEANPVHIELPRYIITGRDLASYVNDDPFQIFYNTLGILIDMGVPMNPSIIKILDNNPAESLSINLGRYDIQTTLAMIGRNALLIAWYMKWNTLFLRPEAYGIEVERIFRDKRNRYGISEGLLANRILHAVRSKNGTVLLSQVYAGGAPLDPSTPSGYATIAGACVTVLKYFFDSNYEIEVYEPDITGSNISNNGMKTTVGQELDKLACNISIGRNWAGVHYWMDAIIGMKKGEKVAISCLGDLIKRYPVYLSISFPSFNEKIITISN